MEWFMMANHSYKFDMVVANVNHEFHVNLAQVLKAVPVCSYRTFLSDVYAIVYDIYTGVKIDGATHTSVDGTDTLRSKVCFPHFGESRP